MLPAMNLPALRFTSASVGCLNTRPASTLAQWLSSRRHLGSTTPVAASPRDDVLRGVAADNREDVARVVELAQRAADGWQTLHSPFYAPPVVADALVALARLADVAAVPWGGYPQAERRRITVGRPEALEPASPDPGAAQPDSVALLQVSGNFLFDAATHRDFLGACLGTGIERSVVGDILVQGETGAQILVAPAMVEHLEGALTQVRSVPVRCRLVEMAQLRAPAPREQEVSSVEASLRLDAIASAGFRLSRSKMLDLIKAGDVRLNWRGAGKASVEVAAGDVISVAGKGRLEVRALSQTKRGKWAVQMVRYV
jgi:photosystem II S4 domain protein